MRVSFTCIHLELLEHLLAKLVLGQHATNRAFKQHVGLVFQHPGVAAERLTTGVTGEATEELAVALGAGDLELACVV